MYINPSFSDYDYGLFRIGGPGLANCLIILGRAYLISKINDTPLLQPTWPKFSIGPWIRNEKDKRLYLNLFFLSKKKALYKSFVMTTYTKMTENNISLNNLKMNNEIKSLKSKRYVININSLGGYFSDLLSYHKEITEFFFNQINPNSLSLVPQYMPPKSIAVHVRLGDYRLTNYQLDIYWYKQIIINLNKIFKDLQFFLFSDGSDEELKELLDIKNVKRVYYGNAIADIIAISRCSLVIGSDSTFSGMGCFISQIPAIFSKCHYGTVLINNDDFLLCNNSTEIPNSFINQLKKRGI